MTRETISLISVAGAGKQRFAKNQPWRFLCRAAFAGFFIVVGTLISNICGSLLLTESPAAAKLLAAATFSVALILIVLLGGELFTGSNLVMSISLYEGEVGIGAVLRVWLLCYVGNFLGILFLCALISFSGAEKALELLGSYIAACIPAKCSCPWYELLIKAALCNFLVCIGVFSGFRLKSEGGKALVIICVITTFILCGFEHSVANMATFSFAALLLPDAQILPMLYNLLWVSIGNILGGALLCAFPLYLCAEPKSQAV